MYGKPAITCFKYQVFLYDLSHHLFECYTLTGYRASTMSHQTAPTPHYRQPYPHTVSRAIFKSIFLRQFR